MFAAPPSDAAALDAELAEEFEYHLAKLRDEELDAGADSAAAEAHALRRFGDPARHARACRRVVFGVLTMKRGLLIGWNVALVLGLVLTFMLAKDAHRRALHAGLQVNIVSGAVPADTRAAVLSSIWTARIGEVHVKGAVVRPGGFATSIAQPISVAQLLEMAGAAPEARHVTMVRPGRSGEASVSVENAYRYREELQLMPEPGTVVTIH